MLRVMMLAIGFIVCSAFNVQSGRTYPKMPQEFAATMLQQKWNSNGFYINHTCSGSYYSSYAKQKIRADCSDFPLTTKSLTSKNRTLGQQFGRTEISVIDFAVTPATSTLFSKKSIADPGKCVVYNASWLPPMKSTFLEDVKAIFITESPDPTQRGRDVEQWTFTLMNTQFIFYFDTQFRRFVGYSFTSNSGSTSLEQSEVGVWTTFINAWGTDEPDFFEDALFANQCPAGSN